MAPKKKPPGITGKKKRPAKGLGAPFMNHPSPPPPNGPQKPGATRIACHAVCALGESSDALKVTIKDTEYLYHPWWHNGRLWVLKKKQWVPAGEFHVVGEGVTDSPDGLGLSWGTFTIGTGALGDFEGRWSWDWAQGHNGHGVGNGSGASTGKTVKITFLIHDPAGLPAPPADPCPPPDELQGYGYLKVTVS